MIYKIQSTILRIHEFKDSITSLNFGIVFILSLAAFIFSIYCIYSVFISKDFGNRSKVEKIIFPPALVLSLVFILDLILAGDIYPNLSAEKLARLFAESLCDDEIEEFTDWKNKDTDRCKVLTAEYRDQFFKDWKEKSKEFTDIHSSADDFDLIEYHYKHLNITDFEKCLVIIRSSKILNALEILNMKERDAFDKILHIDYDFEIGLIKVPIPSRFLGNYMRWRIFSFAYEKSKPYTMKEWLEQFEQP